MLKIEREEFINKTFRLNKKQVDQMQAVCLEKNISMNRLVSICIEYALDHLDEEVNKKRRT